MPATPAWLAPVESLLNRSIASSAKAAAAARRLDKTSVEVDVEGMMRLRVAVTGDRLVIAAASDGDAPANAGISASALALLGLAAQGGDLEAGAGREGLRIRGDAEVANRYRELVEAGAPRSRGGAVALGGRRAGASAVPRGQDGALLGTPRAAHRRPEHRRISAGGEPRPRQPHRARGISRRRRSAARSRGPHRGRSAASSGGSGTRRDARCASRAPAARDPARAGAPRSRRFRPRHAPVPAVPFLLLSVALDLVPAQRRRHARRAAASRARGAGADLRQIRPGALDAPRSAAGRHRRRAREAAGPRAARSTAPSRWRPSSARSGASSRRYSRASSRPRSPRPRSRRCTPRRSRAARTWWSRFCARGMREIIDLDLEVLRGAGGAGRRVLGRRPPAAARSRSCANTARPSWTSST